MTLASMRRVAGSLPGRLAIEAVVAISLFSAAAKWGSWYWHESLVIGRHPFFYQLYYEPAVMVACGKGFVIAQPQVPEMTRFLTEQTQSFDCADIPASTRLTSEGLYQGSSRYLMTAVGWTWRSVGVSWRKLGPFAGVLFGLTIVAAYAIFRLGMGRVLAVLCASALSLSALHLLNLPNLRDYAKAPFTLLLIFLLGLIVTIRPSWPRILAISAAAGLVLGVGYGFRSDLLIVIPAFVLTAFLFLDAGWRTRVMYAAAASAVFMATFYVTALPVINSVKQTWGCQWHTAIIGLGADVTRDLQVEAAPYDWLDGMTDEFVYATSTSYAARTQSGLKHIDYCGPDYDTVTRGFMLDVVRHTPGDFLVRAYASALQMVQLPVRWRNPPMPKLATNYYDIRKAIVSAVPDAGLFLVVAVLVLVMARSIRLGWFLIAFVLYFGGYPAVQFANRHFFHLEFITWWALGFLVQQLVTRVVAVVRKRPAPTLTMAALRRSALALAGSWAVLFACLWIGRWYQDAALEPLMQQYVHAQLEELPVEPVAGGLLRVPPVSAAKTDPETADLLEVDLNEWQCPVDSKLSFVYKSPIGFARDFMIQSTGLPRTATRVFLPVYSTFQGVIVREARPECIAGVYRVRHPEQFALMPKVVLRPGWEDQPLHQSLMGWGIEPPPDE